MLEKLEIIKKNCENIVGSDNVKVSEPLSQHTSFQIGGPADLFVSPRTEEELIELIDYIQDCEVPFYLVGNGCNLLAGDLGFRGVIIDLSKLTQIRVEDNLIEAACGAKLRDIAQTALKNSLTGYEFASGIPGTIGGAACMNAGAYGGEHKDVIQRVRYLEDGQIKEADNEECEFSYRQSIFKNSGKTVLSVTLALEEGESTKIEEKMKELKEKRVSKQPLNYPSAGSTFKRPPGYFAGKLIQDNGFKGFELGGAAVSDKHSGFIINKNKATAQDVLNLIHLIQKTIKQNEGVDLETEVIFIGEQNDENDS